MRVLLLLALFGVAGCTIDPVIMTPEPKASGCREAARDYCRDVIRPLDDEMRECVSRYAYECASRKN